MELRRYEDAKGQERVALAVRSDVSVTEQIHADGATWLDRELVARQPTELGEGGFGRDVKEVLDARTEHLIEEGLVRRMGQRVIFARNRLGTLRDREIDALGSDSPPKPACRSRRWRTVTTSQGSTASACPSRQAAIP